MEYYGKSIGMVSGLATESGIRARTADCKYVLFRSKLDLLVRMG